MIPSLLVPLPRLPAPAPVGAPCLYAHRDELDDEPTWCPATIVVQPDSDPATNDLYGICYRHPRDGSCCRQAALARDLVLDLGEPDPPGSRMDGFCTALDMLLRLTGKRTAPLRGERP